MDNHIVVFEGYDGSGKTSLIKDLRERSADGRIRVVGRKNEPELRLMSSAIEDESEWLQHDTEILLRFALETGRQHIVRAALSSNELVVLDRGVPSLVSWIDYYQLPRSPFEALERECLKLYHNALLVVCVADFETCWSRIEEKESLSKKERLGREVNRRFYEQYVANVERLACLHAEVVHIDTASRNLSESCCDVWTAVSRFRSP
jgi:thymidylate kinase